MWEALHWLAREVAALKQRMDRSLKRGQATVSATPGGGQVTISYHGGTLTVAHLAQYSPTIGDTVWLLQDGADLLVLGNQ